MPQGKKRKKKAAEDRTSGFFLRAGCLVIILAGLTAGYVVLTKKPLEKIPLLGKIAVQYREVKDVRERMSSITWDGTLCFGDENSDYLIKEFRKITALPQVEHKAAALVRELIAGPKGKGIRTLPEGVQLRSITRDADLVMVDFSRDLIIKHPGGSTSEMMTVFSIVNTLTMNIPEIKRVKLLVEGKAMDTLAGHIDCKDPIAAQPGLVH